MPAPPTREYRIPGFRVCLVREPGVVLEQKPLVQTPRDAVPIFAEYIGDRDREVFALALLTIRRRVICLHTVSVGCLSSSLVHPREVFKPAILAGPGASAVLLAHNHPSGCPEPSAEDLTLTRRLVDAGRLLGIDVLDHIILGENGRFVSLRDRGHI